MNNYQKIILIKKSNYMDFNQKAKWAYKQEAKASQKRKDCERAVARKFKHMREAE